MTTPSCIPARFDAASNFYLPATMPLKKGIRLDIFCLFMRLTTVNPRKTKRDVSRIRKLDEKMRKQTDPDEQSRLKDKLILLTRLVLTRKQTRELSHMSVLFQTYPYVSEASKNGAIEWLSEDAVSKAREIKIKRENTRKSWCRLSKHDD